MGYLLAFLGYGWAILGLIDIIFDIKTGINTMTIIIHGPGLIVGGIGNLIIKLEECFAVLLSLKNKLNGWKEK